MQTPELAMMAVLGDGMALQHIPQDERSAELCQVALQGDRIALY